MGVAGAYWVLIVMPMFPLITYIGYRIVILIWSEETKISKDSNINKNRQSITEIEIVINLKPQISNV